MYLKRVWLAFVVALFSGLIYWPQNSSATLLEYSFRAAIEDSFGEIRRGEIVFGSFVIDLNAPPIFIMDTRRAGYSALSDIRLNIDGQAFFAESGTVTVSNNDGIPVTNDSLTFSAFGSASGNVTGDIVNGARPSSFGLSFLGPLSLFSSLDLSDAVQSAFTVHDDIFNVMWVGYIFDNGFGDGVEFSRPFFSVRELPAPAPIPLPATAWLFLPALLGLAFWLRNR